MRTRFPTRSNWNRESPGPPCAGRRWRDDGPTPASKPLAAKDRTSLRATALHRSLGGKVLV